MKVKGQSVDLNTTGEVELVRADKVVTIKVKGTPLGYENVGDKLFPTPVPPQDFAKDKKGMPLRDPATGKPMMVEDPLDPTYVEAAENAFRMQLVVMAVSVMVDVQFDSPKPIGSKDWYLDVYEELRAAGVTITDIRTIIEKSRELSNMSAARLKGAAESF